MPLRFSLFPVIGEMRLSVKEKLPNGCVGLVQPFFSYSVFSNIRRPGLTEHEFYSSKTRKKCLISKARVKSRRPAATWASTTSLSGSEMPNRRRVGTVSDLALSPLLIRAWRRDPEKSSPTSSNKMIFSSCSSLPTSLTTWRWGLTWFVTETVSKTWLFQSKISKESSRKPKKEEPKWSRTFGRSQMSRASSALLQSRLTEKPSTHSSRERDTRGSSCQTTNPLWSRMHCSRTCQRSDWRSLTTWLGTNPTTRWKAW